MLKATYQETQIAESATLSFGRVTSAVKEEVRKTAHGKHVIQREQFSVKLITHSPQRRSHGRPNKHLCVKNE